MRSLSTAATGMQAQQTNIEVIANNLANLSTTGYKRQRAEFQDLLYQSDRRVGAQSSQNGSIVPAGVAIGVGVRNSSVERIHLQGNLSQTGNPTDLAIQGKGMFLVTLPDGTTAYTRDGSLKLSATGQLVTQDGYQLNPQIQIPNNATSIAVSAAGQVQVTIPGQPIPQVVGTINLATAPPCPGTCPIQLQGFVTPFGTAPPDFTATSIQGGSSLPQQLVVTWASGTATPFSSFSGTGWVLNLTGATTQQINTGPWPQLTTLPTNLLISTAQASPASLQLAMGTGANAISVFNTAAGLEGQIGKTLSSTTTAHKVVAVGQYDGASTFNASRISIVLQ